jgi:hypothetical protein
LKHEIAVTLRAILAPQFDNGAVISYDAIGKDEAAARLQPHQHNDQHKNKYGKDNNDRRQPRPPLLEQMDVWRCLRLPNVAEVRRKIKSGSTKVTGEKR